MATFAEKWYNRSGDIVLKQDITEVEIVRSYSLTGNEVVSWDASADGDRSVMAYITGTKLTIVCDSFTDIPKGMFSGFISLEKVTGLRSATTVGKHAFAGCYSLKEIDLDPANLTSLGEGAFRMSNVEDVLDLSLMSSDAEVGDWATRAKRWGDKLADVQSVQFPANKIYFDVPNADSQVKAEYADIPFVTQHSYLCIDTLMRCYY